MLCVPVCMHTFAHVPPIRPWPAAWPPAAGAHVDCKRSERSTLKQHNSARTIQKCSDVRLHPCQSLVCGEHHATMQSEAAHLEHFARFKWLVHSASLSTLLPPNLLLNHLHDNKAPACKCQAWLLSGMRTDTRMCTMHLMMSPKEVTKGALAHLMDDDELVTCQLALHWRMGTHSAPYGYQNRERQVHQLCTEASVVT